MIEFYLENYIAIGDWQFRYIRGQRSYVRRTKKVRKHVL